MLKLTETKRSKIIAKVFNKVLNLSDYDLIKTASHLKIELKLEEDNFSTRPLVMWRGR